MTNQTKNNIEFNLDPFELTNKPRRLFTGLRMKVNDNSTANESEKALVLEMIDEMERDFYAVTLKKFEVKINDLV